MVDDYISHSDIDFNCLMWRGHEQRRRKQSDFVLGSESLWLCRFASASTEDLPWTSVGAGLSFAKRRP